MSSAVSSTSFLPPSQNMSYTNLSASPLPTIALLFVSYLAYRITQSFIARRRFHAFAQQHGCEEPPDVTGPFPFKSWSFIWRMMCEPFSKTPPSSSYSYSQLIDALAMPEKTCWTTSSGPISKNITLSKRRCVDVRFTDLVEHSSTFAMFCCRTTAERAAD